jgi:hypothetical protein
VNVGEILDVADSVYVDVVVDPSVSLCESLRVCIPSFRLAVMRLKKHVKSVHSIIS